MGAPTIGGTTSGSVTEGGGVGTGNLDDVGLGTSNTDDVWSISSSATYGTATINSSTGVWTYDLDDSNPTVKALDLGDTLTDVFTVYMLDADGRWDTQVVTITINGVMCFGRGTPIETQRGPRLIEALRPGDLVKTLDHGLQPLRWIGSHHVDAADIAANPKLRPVRISADALGRGMPVCDLLVSPQHRVLLRNGSAEDDLGEGQVLVPAVRLVGMPGISVDERVTEIDYYHLLFDRHEIVLSAGAPTESLFTGPQALATLSNGSQSQIAAILPEVLAVDHDPVPARPIVERGRSVRRLLARLSCSDGGLIPLSSDRVKTA